MSGNKDTHTQAHSGPMALPGPLVASDNEVAVKMTRYSSQSQDDKLQCITSGILLRWRGSATGRELDLRPVVL